MSTDPLPQAPRRLVVHPEVQAAAGRLRFRAALAAKRRKMGSPSPSRRRRGDPRRRGRRIDGTTGTKSPLIRRAQISHGRNKIARASRKKNR